MKRLGRRILTLATAALLLTSIELTTLADTWYLEQGDVVVNAGDSGQSVSQGTVTKADSAPVITQQDSSVATSNTITVNAENGADANVTIQDVNIEARGEAAMTVNRSEGSEVTVELNGGNSLTGGGLHAGMETHGTGKVIIQDENMDGSLTAKGGTDSAGIGGADEEDGINITIAGGKIVAQGDSAAGIGGGEGGSGKDITILDGEVYAYSDIWGAGIGGSLRGEGSNIVIKGGTVTAQGGSGAAGIGGGSEGEGSNIAISGGNITAVGGGRASGIGGGDEGKGENITITGGDITATGGSSGAGIGGGNGGNGENITITGGNVATTGGSGAAGIGGGREGDGNAIAIKGGEAEAIGGLSGAGIGGGYGADGTNITISGGDVTAEGGMYGAGIGGGNRGNGSDVAISGGTVQTTGGKEGAGIGGGTLGNGSDVTITGGNVTAQGVSVAAGIGGGYKGTGTNVTISGGTVTALGGSYAAGIGGGTYGTGSNLVVKHNAVVTAYGQNDAADSGNGEPLTGPREQDNINLDDLYTTGSYTNRYGTVYGTKVPPVPKVEWPHLCSRYGAQIRQGNLYCSCGKLLLKLFEADCPWVEKLENGVLTVTVEESDAILIYWLFGIQALVEQDVHTLVFETEQAKTVLELEDWLAENTAEGEFQIQHMGKESSISKRQ